MYNQKLLKTVKEVDRINDMYRWTMEGLYRAEWKYLNSKNISDEDFKVYEESIKDIHYHIEAILNYTNQLSEDLGIEVCNGC